MGTYCHKCQCLIAYNEKWDAYFCAHCNIWLEKKCEDPDCLFRCQQRPEKPISGDKSFDALTHSCEHDENLKNYEYVPGICAGPKPDMENES